MQLGKSLTIDNFSLQGTVLIKTAQELLDYSKGEENVIEEVRIFAQVTYRCRVFMRVRRMDT